VAVIYLKSCEGYLSRLRSACLWEPPGADPHAGWCGEGERKTPPYPINYYFHFLKYYAPLALLFVCYFQWYLWGYLLILLLFCNVFRFQLFTARYEVGNSHCHECNKQNETNKMDSAIYALIKMFLCLILWILL